ncbi:MAG TPA: hypothetical protein VJT49_19140 [Amycolatopsis sp.]|uniref:hypothetical protein n=1 Tax=Amycolatopsis sp. TaxID=37632 RepID=UPI002B4627A7|nr:hypothetical protein [Amycolatopsis sp.]HKS47183.1 hypothetical protein [Amycolatopsis sp.]
MPSAYGVCHQRKRAAGRSQKEAMRCPKRQLSDVVYRQLVRDADRALAAGPGGHPGNESIVQRG